jgi:hypothetical protein
MLDLNVPRLIRLSPNWAAPIPLPGEPAFLTLTEVRLRSKYQTVVRQPTVRTWSDGTRVFTRFAMAPMRQRSVMALRYIDRG